MIAEGTSASKNLVDSLLTLYSEFSEVQEEYRCELQDQSLLEEPTNLLLSLMMMKAAMVVT